MPIAECISSVDSRGRELLQHGTAAFPIACYHDNLRENPVPWHWHEELEAAVITEGYCTVAAGKEKYVLGPGEGFFINSSILHGCRELEGAGCRFHSLVFHPRLVGGSLDSVFYQDYVAPLLGSRAAEGMRLLPSVPWQREALEAIEEAWQLYAGEERGYEFRVREALSRLVLLLWEHLPAPGKKPGAKTLRDGERMKAMLTFLHDHWAEALDTGRIAASASISESECLRCFRGAIGTTPIQYLRGYRLRQAALLLSGTNMPVADIAAQCGFPDASYFTKTFREERGCTPSEFRKQQGSTEK